MLTFNYKDGTKTISFSDIEKLDKNAIKSYNISENAEIISSDLAGLSPP